MVNETEQGITVKIVGGLGNQLFGYAAGLSLSKQLNCPLFLDTSWFLRQRAFSFSLNNFNLEGCTIYTSCEPCPMCLSACYWARLEKIHYANGREDAANIGFDDQFIYDEIKKEMIDRKIPMISHDNKIAKEIFKTWFENTNNIRY